MILEGLERGYVENEGKYYPQTHASFAPPSSRSAGARTRQRCRPSRRHHGEARHRHPDHPQKPWEMVANELNDYRRTFHEVNGSTLRRRSAPAVTFCDENAIAPKSSLPLHRRLLEERGQTLRADRDHLTR